MSGYFYNPNIHPYTEFLKRLQTLENYAGTSLLPLTVDKSYDLETFLKGALEYGKDRCLFCYRMRLEKTFQKGAGEGFDAVTTTLLYSKYQRHDDIKAIGEELSGSYGIEFLYEDLRSLYGESRRLSREWGIYRQKYCGCLISEWERYRGY